MRLIRRHEQQLRSAPSRGAFTLVELLFVISIVVILISLLMPAISTGRDSARIMQCNNNLRQIGIGASAYVADNNEVLPYQTHADPTMRGHDQVVLEYLLAPFVARTRVPYGSNSGSKIFLCPSGPLRERVQDGSDWRWNFHGTPTHRNTYEGALYYIYRGSGAESALPRARFSRATETPYQFCSDRQLPWNGLQGASWHTRRYQRPTLFLDGHVATLKQLQYIIGGDKFAGQTSERLLTGPYSTFQLETGGGSPAHAAWDYWIDEY